MARRDDDQHPRRQLLLCRSIGSFDYGSMGVGVWKWVCVHGFQRVWYVSYRLSDLNEGCLQSKACFTPDTERF